MKAREAMTALYRGTDKGGLPAVPGDMPLLEALPRLLDSPYMALGVSEGERVIGVIDRDSMLQGLGRMIAPRDDSSVVTVECAPADFSASRLAHAVEDADMHLVDMLTSPLDGGKVRVTLRVRSLDPGSAVRSLERYGYTVTDSYGLDRSGDELPWERLLELKTLIDV